MLLVAECFYLLGIQLTQASMPLEVTPCFDTSLAKDGHQAFSEKVKHPLLKTQVKR